MRDESAFLGAIAAAPADDAPRLVYADWLDERGESGRAEFLRLDCQLSHHPLADPRTPDVAARVRELAPTLDPDWVALARRVRLPDGIETALERLAGRLNGYNYVVSLGLWRVPVLPGGTAQQYVTAALGPAAVVGEVRRVSGADVAADIGECLRYPGDSASGPNPIARASVEVDSLIGRVLGYVDRSVMDASVVMGFCLREGHPFYPVMWDFAYLWVKPWVAVVFLGSSSD